MLVFHEDNAVVCRAGGGEEQVTSHDQILSIQFNINGEVKHVSSMW